jgi:myosin heavy subunit
MNQIEKRVQSARRRLVLGIFGRAVAVTAFAALLIATVACSVPAFRVVEFGYSTWAISWVAGTLVAAVAAAALYAWYRAPSTSDTALEVDRRFGLRERLASAMSLPQPSRDSAFGIALTQDADRRAAQIEIADRFALKPTRVAWLPLAIVPLLAIVLLLVKPATTIQAGSEIKVDPIEVRQVKTVAKQLQKRLAQQKRKAEAEGLTEAKEMLEKIEADLDKLANRKDLDRKEAMIALNDLKKQLEERREKLGDSDQMRKMMSQMKGMESGPGDKVVKSIQQGEFGKAEEMVRELAKKMKDGELGDKEKEQLKKQVEQMAKAMDQAKEEHEKKREDLQKQIDKAKQEGRGKDADQLQQELEKEQQKDQQMQQMQQMAQAMQQAAEAMKNGDTGKASEAMEQMADQLGDLQQEMDELEELDSAMDDMSQSKQQMRCKDCNGQGCQGCQGSQGEGFGDRPGQGQGRGNGSGDRPESDVETNTYDTQVRGIVKKGKAVIAGNADGPNRKGVTRETLQSSIEKSLSQESDPAENQVLPRTEREHAQQYFDELRK